MASIHYRSTSGTEAMDAADQMKHVGGVLPCQGDSVFLVQDPGRRFALPWADMFAPYGLSGIG